MKKSVPFLLILFIAMIYGCNGMKSVEDDMSNLLEHMEIDSLAQKSAVGTDTAAPSASQAAGNDALKPVNPTRTTTHRITIQAFPRESTVKIMNIRSRYYPGIRLNSGKYDILVEHPGYKLYREWINVDADIILKIILEKETEPAVPQPVESVRQPEVPEPETLVYTDTEAPDSSEPPVIIETGPDPADGESAAAVPFPTALSGHYGSVSSLCFSPDGMLLASGSYDTMVIVWKIDDGSMVHHLNHGDRVSAVAFSPDGGVVASAGSDKVIKLWDAASGELRQTLTGHADRIYSVSFDLTGKSLVSGGNNELIIWDAASGKIKNLIVGDDKLYPVFGSINAIAFNPTGKDADGYEFAFTCNAGIALFNPETKQLLTLEDTAPPHSVVFRSDGQYIAWGARHHHYKNEFFPRIVRADTKRRDAVLSRDDEMAKADRVFYTAYTPDGNHLLMLTYNQAVVYDIKAGAVIKTFSGTSETAVTAAALSPDGQILAASAKDEIRIWKLN